MLLIKPSAIFGFHRSASSSSSCHCWGLLLVQFFNSAVPKRSKVLVCKDEDCNDFMPWLEGKAGARVSSVLSIGKSSYGRTLVAARVIQAGECILRVPFRAQISPSNVPEKVKEVLGDDVGNTARLALVILAEQRKGQDSEWAPYIRCLPSPDEMHNSILWNEDELEMIRLSPVYQATIDHLDHIKKEYMSLTPVLNHFPLWIEDLTFEYFKYAYSTVSSRAWGSTNNLFLIPFADFSNHDGASESVVLIDDSMQVSEVLADRDYCLGEEVFIRYGKFPSSTLLLNFGFTLPCNIHDQVQIQVDMPQSDPLRAVKLDMIRKHHLAGIKDISFNTSGVTFLIKKVRSTKGKGKGIPQSLRAFYRVMSCHSTEELSNLALEAAQHDGRLARRPLTDCNKEIDAHQMLLSTINKLIDKNDSEIKYLRFCRAIGSGVKYHHRRQMGLDLLGGEINVLRSASDWLKSYCYNYQAQSCDHQPLYAGRDHKHQE